MKDFLRKIQKQGYLGFSQGFVGQWANGKNGCISIKQDGCIIFEEYTDDLVYILCDIDENGISHPKEPLLLNYEANDFLFWLIIHIQAQSVDFKDFYNSCQKSYLEKHRNDPDYWKWKDVPDQKFDPWHYCTIKLQLSADVPFYEYLDEEDKRLLKSYCTNYREWLECKIGEFQQENNTPMVGKLTLPSELDTKNAREYFAKAIEVGYMERTNNGYKWLFGGNRGQARLGYFCNKAYSTPRPINKLEQIFKVQKLSSSISNADIEAKRSDVKEWRKEIDDKIFKK